jgi:autotransporter strand-loop-strand O-heptosyltransferase
MYPDVKFVVERWIYNYVASKCDIKESLDWIRIETVNRFDNVDRSVWKDDQFQCNFIDGPYLNIAGTSDREYETVYSVPDNPDVYTTRQKVGMWSRPNVKYFREWTVKAFLDKELKFEHTMDLKGVRVLISMSSKALGDTIAWMPYVEEFRKKHDCHVICAGWWNQIFDYPEIEFVEPGAKVEDIYASYSVGCFDDQLDKNVKNWRETPLQKVAADILGIEYEPIRAKLKEQHFVAPHICTDDPLGQGPYICFSEFSTMQNKMWNRPGAWQKTINYLNTLKYSCVSVSVEPTELEHVWKHNGQSIEQSIADIAGATFYVGLNHGPAWIAYALGVPVVMITGVSEEFNDFPNPYRVVVDTGCKPCFNNLDIPIDRSWDWCVNEDKFVCTREITELMVQRPIDKLHVDKVMGRLDEVKGVGR